MTYTIQTSRLPDSTFVRIGLQSPLPEYRSLAVTHHGEHKATKTISALSAFSAVNHRFTLSTRDEFIVARHHLTPGDHV
ncbi:MAG: hypothetical protein HYZ35_03435, partial [Chloroflexi bacterium]|nr:hypothetical protein [Chloroflexota bacterium]